MSDSLTLRDIKRLLEAQVRTNIASTPPFNLTDAVQIVRLEAQAPNQADVPDRDVRLGLLTLDLTTIAGATSVTAYLALTSGGSMAITDEVTAPIIFMPGTLGANGSVAIAVDSPYHLPSGAHGLHLVVRLDAGTASCIARIVFTTKTPIVLA